MTATERDAMADLLVENDRLRRRLDRERTARSEAERIAEQATRLSIEDPLTGLANRTLLTATLENELARAARSEREVALLYIDLDRFKLINDTYGHDAGDEILCSVAERLRARARASDTVGRLGGDEFLVIAPDIGERGAAALATDLAAEIESVRPESAGGTGCGASIGVALLSGDVGIDAEQYVRRADAAMYAAKAAGHPVRLFDDDLLEASEIRREVRRALPEAIRTETFIVHHQPFVRLDDHEIVGFEALTRWVRDDGSLISPGHFIPVAEEGGQIGDLGQLVSRLALSDLARWRTLHPGSDAFVAINASARELAHPAFVDRLAQLLDAHDLPADHLTVEVTETAMFAAGPTADANLSRLQALGAQTALDDFGTGYSSIERLRSQRFDIVKVDQGFVAGVAERAEDRAVVQAIVALAGAFEMTVLAEGVETRAQLEVVTELGCDLAQGWHFAPAAPIEEVGPTSRFRSDAAEG